MESPFFEYYPGAQYAGHCLGSQWFTTDDPGASRRVEVVVVGHPDAGNDAGVGGNAVHKSIDESLCVGTSGEDHDKVIMLLVDGASITQWRRNRS
jgi:hypothetical protein